MHEMRGCVVAVSNKFLSCLKQLAHPFNKEAISQVHMIRRDTDSLAAGSFFISNVFCHFSHLTSNSGVAAP